MEEHCWKGNGHWSLKGRRRVVDTSVEPQSTLRLMEESGLFLYMYHRKERFIQVVY